MREAHTTPKEGFHPVQLWSAGMSWTEMELGLITAAWARRYEFVLRSDKIEVNDGLARKSIVVHVVVKRQEVVV